MAGLTCSPWSQALSRTPQPPASRVSDLPLRLGDPHPWCHAVPGVAAQQGPRGCKRQMQCSSGSTCSSAQLGSCGWLKHAPPASCRRRSTACTPAAARIPQVNTFVAAPLPSFEQPTTTAWLHPSSSPFPQQGLAAAGGLASSILPAGDLTASRLATISGLPFTIGPPLESFTSSNTTSISIRTPTSSSSSASSLSSEDDASVEPDPCAQQQQQTPRAPCAVPADAVEAAVLACSSWEQLQQVCNAHAAQFSPRITYLAILQLAKVLKAADAAAAWQNSSSTASSSRGSTPAGSREGVAGSSDGSGSSGRGSPAMLSSPASSLDGGMGRPPLAGSFAAARLGSSLAGSSMNGSSSGSSSSSDERSSLFGGRSYTAQPPGARSSIGGSRAVRSLLGTASAISTAARLSRLPVRPPPMVGAGAMPTPQPPPALGTSSFNSASSSSSSSAAQGLVRTLHPINFSARPRPQRPAVAPQADVGPPAAVGAEASAADESSGTITINVSPAMAAAEGLLDNDTMQQRMARVQAAREEQQRQRLPVSSAGSAAAAQQQQRRDLSRQQQQQQEALMQQLLMRLTRTAAGVSVFDHMRVLLALVRLGYRQPRLLEQLFTAALPTHRLKRSSLDVLQSLAFAVSSLDIEAPASWVNALVQRLQPRLQQLAPLQQVQVVFSLQRLGWQPPAELAGQLAAAVVPHLQGWEPQQLVLTAQVLAALKHTPDDTWMAAFFAATQPLLPVLQPGQLVALLSTLAALGRKPEDGWLRGCYTALRAAALGHLTAAQWPELLLALSRMGVRPDSSWLRELYGANMGVLPQLAPGQLVGLAQGAQGTGMQPPEVWVAAVLLQCFQKMPFATAGDLAGMGIAVAGLKATPGALWLQQWEARVAQRMPLCSGPEMGRLMVATVALRHKPSSSWMVQLEARSHDQLRQFGPEGLAATAKAMADAKMQPALSWLYAFVSAAYSCLDGFTGHQLVLLFESLFRLVPESRWVDDLVQICSFERSAAQATLAAGACAAAGAGGTSSDRGQARSSSSGGGRQQGRRQQRRGPSVAACMQQ